MPHSRDVIIIPSCAKTIRNSWSVTTSPRSTTWSAWTDTPTSATRNPFWSTARSAGFDSRPLTSSSSSPRRPAMSSGKENPWFVHESLLATLLNSQVAYDCYPKCHSIQVKRLLRFATLRDLPEMSILCNVHMSLSWGDGSLRLKAALRF